MPSKDSDIEIDFSKTTFEGVRLEHLRQWQKLTVRQRLEALDELTDIAERLGKERKQIDADVMLNPSSLSEDHLSKPRS